MDQLHNNPITIGVRDSISVPVVRALPAMAVVLFGLLTLYCVGFSSLSIAHNATHDTRHASGFPCH